MIDYIYDGSFEGVLTCIYHHYYTDRAAGIYTRDCYQASFLNSAIEVITEPEKSDRVYKAIEEKLSVYDLRAIYRVFLSNAPDKEMMILNYIALGFRAGHSVSSLYGNDMVKAFQETLKRVYTEKERMLQFVRFSLVEGGVLYAEIEPDNDLLELLHTHFCDRYRNDPFIIRDVRRNKALVAYNMNWYISDFRSDEVPVLDEEEKSYRRLWKTYFENIAIAERKKARCQRNFMPERYWKHLTECSTL